MNYKKVINIILRCALHIFALSRLFNNCPEINPFLTISLGKGILDFFLFCGLFYWLTYFSDNAINIIVEITVCTNLLFFTYFYAKLCGLYKLFKTYKLWQKHLIFLSITLLIFPVAMFDFKNFKIFDNFFFENNQITIIATMFFVMFAFYLNLFFEFLTKKFPKPFEKIGYWFSIEFYSNLIQKFKR